MVVSERPRWQPAVLGTLDRVLVLEEEEEPSRLFPGDDAYFSERQLQQHERLWTACQPILERVLGDDEVILCVAPALRKPPIGVRAAFAFLWHGFFRTALVLTDRRLVEVLLDGRGRRPQGRVWSLPWSQADTVVMSGRTLAYRSAGGPLHRWWLPGRSDRELVRELVPRIDDQLVPGEVPVPRPVPVRHCPSCAGAAVRESVRCGACGAWLTTAATAGWLGLALPGLGLWYAGQRLLALTSVALEAGLVVWGVSRLLQAESLAVGLRATAVALAALVVVRLESVALSRILGARTRVVASPRRWRTAGWLGAGLTVVVVAGAVLLGGQLANRVDRTPDFAGNQIGWVSAEVDSIDLGALTGVDRTDIRSAWWRGDGPILVVRSTTVPSEATFAGFARSWRSGVGGEATPESEVIAGLECVRLSWIEDGRQVVEWLVSDQGHRDVHVLTVVALPGTRADVERDLATLLRSVEWRAAE